MIVAGHGVYRPDIDGLRAVSVIAVLLFHAFPEYVPGGFAGVDVFFVISGFLISQILFEAVTKRQLSFRQFYAKRIRRLFPALVVVLTFVVAVGWFVLLPQAFADLGAQIAASSVFAANIYFWLQAGYFSPASHSLPLLHLWSLGVEEQFYIAWPIGVMLLASRRRLIVAASTVGLASFVLSMLLADKHNLDFYSPFTRAWELMAGAVLAGLRERLISRSFAADAVVAIGLIGLVACFMLLDSTAQYPSWRAGVPVAAAMMIIVAGQSSRLARVALENRPAVYVGRISYPLYLWHWPLLVLAASVKFLPLTLLERGVIVAVSFGAAMATYELVERPVRTRKSSARQISALSGSMVAAALSGVVIVQWNGFEGRFPPDIRTAYNVRPHPAMRMGECLLDLAAMQTDISDRCIEPERPLIAVWGDSTAASLMPGLRDLQSREHFGIAQFTANSCPPVLGRSVPSACQEHNDRVSRLIKNIRPDVVLVHGFGPLNEDWLKAVDFLASIGSKIVVLGPVPAWKRRLPDQALSYYITRRSLLPDRSSSFVSNLWNDQTAGQLFTAHGARFISAWQIFCDADGCLTRNADGTLTTFDAAHLSEKASIFLIHAIEEQIRTRAGG
jgi:peptidoglycan/LPS O-acetylase OafA/YrhL